MKFEEVLPAVRRGQKVRRRNWNSGDVFFYRGNADLWLSNSDLFEEDWEMINSKKEISRTELERAYIDAAERNKSLNPRFDEMCRLLGL